MTRVDLLTTGHDLTPEARAVADRIVESRGDVTRPFQLLLHAPELAERAAELGHVVRSGSSLTDADRELVTLETGRVLGCAFVWGSHVDAAVDAGVSPDTISMLQGDPARLGERDRILVSFVDELCGTGSVSDPTFGAALGILGDRAVVELALTVGYYTMLGYVMGACDAC